MNVLEFEIN